MLRKIARGESFCTTDFAARGGEQAADDFEKGGFSPTVLSTQNDEISLFDGE